MQVEFAIYSALLEAGVSRDKTEPVADALLKSIDQRHTAHAALVSTKADIEALRADVFEALTNQT